MSRVSRGAANSVSLFPFLAVLICAMGALIFLLLITTRRIRQEVLAAAEPAVPEVVQPVEPEAEQKILWSAEPETETVTPPERDWDLAAGIGELPGLNPNRLGEEVAFAPPPPRELPAETPPDPNVAWSKKARELAAQRREEEANLQEKTNSLQVANASLQQVQEDIDRLIAQIKAIELEQQETAQSKEQIEEQAWKLLRSQSAIEAAIQKAKRNPKTASSKYSFVAYDGQSGTTRRPIMIECTDKSINFMGEGVAIKPQDLRGFIPAYNPVLAGTLVMVNYWESQAGVNEPPPYVLLVVRPSGTASFYITRQLLKNLKQPYGYELVEEDAPIAAPPTPPDGIRVCQAAVDALLQERNQLSAQVQQGRGNNPRTDSGSPTGTGSSPKFRRGPNGLLMVDREDESTTTRKKTDWEKLDGEPLFDPKRPPQLSQTENSGGSRTGSNTPQNPFAPNRENSGRYPPETPLSESNPTSVSRQPGTNSPLTNRRVQPKVVDFRQGTGQNTQGRPGSQPRTDSGSSGGPNPTAKLPGHEIPQRSRNRNRIDGIPQRKMWGYSSPNASIGLEKDVTLKLSSNRLHIGDKIVVPIPQGLSNDELEELMESVLDSQAKSWGSPPRSFYWTPKVKFEVTPDGQTNYLRIAKIMKEAWGLTSTITPAKTTP